MAVKLSLEQKKELIDLVNSTPKKSDAFETFIKKYDLPIKVSALAQQYRVFLKKQESSSKPKPIKTSKLPAGYALMQTILGSEIQLSPDSEIIITPTELRIRL